MFNFFLLKYVHFVQIINPEFWQQEMSKTGHKT
mgnify:CR=1 FL=1